MSYHRLPGEELQLTDGAHEELTEILQRHTFVGIVDVNKCLSLIQHSTKLYLVNHGAIAYAPVSACTILTLTQGLPRAHTARSCSTSSPSDNSETWAGCGSTPHRRSVRSSRSRSTQKRASSAAGSPGHRSSTCVHVICASRTQSGLTSNSASWTRCSCGARCWRNTSRSGSARTADSRRSRCCSGTTRRTWTSSLCSSCDSGPRCAVILFPLPRARLV